MRLNLVIRVYALNCQNDPNNLLRLTTWVPLAGELVECFRNILAKILGRNSEFDQMNEREREPPYEQ